MGDYGTIEVDLSLKVAPAGSHYLEIDRLREEHEIYWNTYAQGYWVLNRAAHVREASQNPEVFSNHSIVATDPDPAYRFLPSFVDPPQHMKYRFPLNRWFSPPNVAKFSPALRESARLTVAEIVADGETDFTTTFGDRFPVRVFLTSMGQPLELADFFVSCVRRMSGATSGRPEDVERMMGAWGDIAAFWTKELADRQASPLDPDTDFVTYLAQSTIDGGPFTDQDMVDTLVTLTLGSLDTLKSMLSWCIYHLAKFPEDRQRLLDDPSMIPTAVEEFLRAYAIVPMARKVTQDVDFHGCPMKKGDMVMLNIPAAARDPHEFVDADKVIIDRKPNRHITFGASEHRCVGSHLARAELVIAVEEWLKAIPDFHIATDEPLMAHGGQISLMSLPLAWDV